MVRQLQHTITGATKSGRDKAKDLAKATSKVAKGGASTKLVGDDFTGGVLWDGPALKYPDGSVAERLHDIYDLGAVSGYILTSQTKGKQLMRERFGRAKSSWNDAAIIMAWTLQGYREFDADCDLEASFHFTEAKLTMSKTDKSPAGIIDCLICTLAGQPVRFDKSAVRRRSPLHFTLT